MFQVVFCFKLSGVDSQHLLKFKASATSLQHHLYAAPPPPITSSTLLANPQSILALNRYHQEIKHSAVTPLHVTGLHIHPSPVSVTSSSPMPAHAHSNISFQLMPVPGLVPEAHTPTAFSFVACPTTSPEIHLKKMPVLIEALLAGQKRLEQFQITNHDNIKTAQTKTTTSHSPKTNPTSNKNIINDKENKNETAIGQCFNLQKDEKFTANLISQVGNLVDGSKVEKQDYEQNKDSKNVKKDKDNNTDSISGLVIEIKEEVISDEDDDTKGEVTSDEEDKTKEEEFVNEKGVNDSTDAGAEVSKRKNNTKYNSDFEEKEEEVEDISNLIIGEVKLEMETSDEEVQMCQYCQKEFHSPVGLHQHERYLCEKNNNIKKVITEIKKGSSQLDCKNRSRSRRKLVQPSATLKHGLYRKLPVGSIASDVNTDDDSDDDEENEDEEDEVDVKVKRSPNLTLTLSETQVQHLRACYRENQKPDEQALGEIGKIIGATKKMVQVSEV